MFILHLSVRTVVQGFFLDLILVSPQDFVANFVRFAPNRVYCSLTSLFHSTLYIKDS